MPGERQIEPFSRQEMHGRPTRERDRKAHQAADEQEDHRGDRVGLDQRLSRDINS